MEFRDHANPLLASAVEPLKPENLAELMTGLGEAMGMPELALDEDGHCLLQVDEKVSLNIA